VVLVMGNQNVAYAMRAASKLRDAGIATATYLDTEKKFKNQVEFADKIGAPFSLIIGDDEAAENVVSLKDMETGKQSQVSVEQVIELLKI
ncbi:MAG: histidine--tRNA ligase, partial [Alphaproteobacteria bacterium]|nr:histidine--tRNA ligase [Alphaproteobacteria bacterium]